MGGQQGFALWLTGMSGAGKTTLGTQLATVLQQRQLKVELLDGDLIRTAFGLKLGFTRVDRIINLKRAVILAKTLVKHDVIAICSFITPYEICRRYGRENINRYVEVYVKCPLDVLIQRDVKGLYRRALSGEIENFTGISDPYEEPENFDFCVETDQETVAESVAKIITWLESQRYIPQQDRPRL